MILPIVLYLSIGGALFILYDRNQMRQHVPYGYMPAVFRLPTIRVQAAIVISLFAPLIMAGALIVGLVLWPLQRIKLQMEKRRLRRAIKRLCENSPEMEEAAIKFCEKEKLL